ncbi:hypothetical protein [Streptomyces sp. NPDC093990]|uniref:hypothetical protein n=1 Tax=Streptomyces sp. NPDC093990 TaxID=3155306 RepID=UPI0034390C07
MLTYGTVQPGRRPSAADEAHALLVRLLRRAAEVGRLRTPVEQATAVARHHRRAPPETSMR